MYISFNIDLLLWFSFVGIFLIMWKEAINMLACGTKHQLEIKSKTLKRSTHIKSTLLFYISLNVIKTFFFHLCTQRTWRQSALYAHSLLHSFSLLKYHTPCCIFHKLKWFFWTVNITLPHYTHKLVTPQLKGHCLKLAIRSPFSLLRLWH